ncbi:MULTISPECIES: DUF2145 domain-containing protein [unclassified Agarivorans]|uniref:DUF2145 domain-containing protein n=1 Tax=unclassified Agarivorans TaxID=2636026 RepID=UPI0026E29737|nr:MULTISPECIES: DUF2145 domain-containing protein [unclassified Agarivorans]MDO6686500.1 DUF2145 domain-containing protein [Agarivorans sp. 3_MG-2023]MDO6715318.1 DUF2145 domain-containing protein [Agarivorans sp. 2_MG-2023]MDO6763366.1 DUF2145 domain-containing protein [Agarivorans sp. 1_MG-2023]
MKILKGLIFASITLLSATCYAGSAPAEEAKHQPEAIAKFSKDVEKYAAAQRANVFIIGRVGRPQKDLPKGIQFTHTALAVYSSITLDSGETTNGYAIYNLYQNQGDLGHSSLVTDHPVDFFWGADSLKAGIIIPKKEVQAGLLALINNGGNHVVHNANYSVLANPYNSQYQNCTEHTLDMLNAAIFDTTDKEELKWLAKSDFNSQPIKINRFKLFMGGLFLDEVTTKDHTGKPHTATFTSIARYLKEKDLIEHSVVLYQHDAYKPLL